MVLNIPNLWRFVCMCICRVFPWGNIFKVEGKHRCNTWQGEFPVQDTAEDGYAGTAPVWKFKQNDYNLHNMVGNVWEWTADWWDIRHSSETKENPVSIY